MKVECGGRVIYRVVFESKKHQRLTRLVGVEYEMSDTQIEELLKHKFSNFSHVLIVDEIGDCMILGEVLPEEPCGMVGT